MAEMTEGFWQFFVISVIGLIGVIIRAVYTSKCNRCSCCGLLIERNIEAEVQEDLAPRQGEADPSRRV
jgi:hypothetical protein